MSKYNGIAGINQQIETLETEVKKFADGLPYWAKYLAERILSGNIISDNDINASYSYLLEGLQLSNKINKPEITINYNAANAGHYKSDLFLTKLENVEGVNALTENQIIEFSPNLTIIYGSNGSGKSGYVRLFKNVFYSKAPEDILQNIHLEGIHKPINAKFTFKTNNIEMPFVYADKDNIEFRQFAVFDGKGLFNQLAQKNEFEFRPAGLSFFSSYTEAIKKVEEKLNVEIEKLQTQNEFAILFDGESEIKTFVENLSAQTKIDDLTKYVPFTEEDKIKKANVQKEYDELLLASKDKNKKIEELENIKRLLSENKQTIEKLNNHVSIETLNTINKAIADCIEKEAIAKTEGTESFKTDKIKGVGTTEWKNFIVSAEAFAKKQKTENTLYPEIDDYCLFCHQPLSDESQILVSNYWTFIKSVAEEDAKKAREILDKAKQSFEKLNFDLFPDDNTLTVWLNEKYPQSLITLKQKLSEQKTLAQNVISDIQNKIAINRTEIQIELEGYTTIETKIDSITLSLRGDEQSKELGRLLKEKTLLEHKEKFNVHFSKFEIYVNNQLWIKTAEKANFAKRQITDTEKYLSNKYFNQKYLDIFNEECKKLNGNFGIDINHTGSAGKSFRQLKLKGQNPNAILSEGEQKVIAIADFLAEMQLSEVNKGIVFDDPVNSLDNDRKKQIADRLVNQANLKQVIIFTHDLVFFYHIKNYSKKYLNGTPNSFIHHSIEKDNLLCGKVILNSSPANEGQYTNSSKAEEWLRKSKASNGNEKIDNAKAGLSALRSSYEALAIFTILGGTVQRFDPQIRMGRLKDIKYEKQLIETVVEKHGEISDLIEGHLPSDEFGLIPSPEILEQQITDFNNLKEQIKNIH
jgi:energy-coupling factor transporter ATP-binding protein EcfA2